MKLLKICEDPEIKQEFKEIKQKMQQLNDNPKVVSDDFNEMYAKLFKIANTKIMKKRKKKKKKISIY